MENIPSEILWEILSYLPSKGHYSFLCSAALVSSRLHALVTPLLYRSLQATHLINGRLSETLHEKEEAAAAVREVRITSLVRVIPTEGLSYRTTTERANAQRVTAAQLQQQLNTLQPCRQVRSMHFRTLCANPRQMDEEGDSIVHDAMVPLEADLLRLPFLSTLRFLSISSPYWTDTDYTAFGAMLIAATNLDTLALQLVQPSSLFEPIKAIQSRHRSFCLPATNLIWNENYYGDEDLGFQMEGLLHTLLHLPRVVKLKMMNGNLDLMAEPNPAYYLPFTRLTHLELEDTEIEGGLPTLCYHCTSLQHLSIEQFWPVDDDISTLLLPPTVSFPHLKTLTLTFLPTRSDEWSDIGETLCSLVAIFNRAFYPALEFVLVDMTELPHLADMRSQAQVKEWSAYGIGKLATKVVYCCDVFKTVMMRDVAGQVWSETLIGEGK